MEVREIMTKNPEFLGPDASARDIANKMKDLKCGFIPVAEDDKLIGVVTDRDLALRVIAEGRDPEATQARDVVTERVLYCFEDDSTQEAAKSMKKNNVVRLVVLNRDKRLRGIVTHGDLAKAAKHEGGKLEDEVCRVAGQQEAA